MNVRSIVGDGLVSIDEYQGNFKYLIFAKMGEQNVVKKSV